VSGTAEPFWFLVVGGITDPYTGSPNAQFVAVGSGSNFSNPSTLLAGAVLDPGTYGVLPINNASFPTWYVAVTSYSSAVTYSHVAVTTPSLAALDALLIASTITTTASLSGKYVAPQSWSSLWQAPPGMLGLTFNADCPNDAMVVVTSATQYGQTTPAPAFEFDLGGSSNTKTAVRVVVGSNTEGFTIAEAPCTAGTFKPFWILVANISYLNGAAQIASFGTGTTLGSSVVGSVVVENHQLPINNASVPWIFGFTSWSGAVTYRGMSIRTTPLPTSSITPLLTVTPTVVDTLSPTGAPTPYVYHTPAYDSLYPPNTWNASWVSPNGGVLLATFYAGCTNDVTIAVSTQFNVSAPNPVVGVVLGGT